MKIKLENQFYVSNKQQFFLKYQLRKERIINNKSIYINKNSDKPG